MDRGDADLGAVLVLHGHVARAGGCRRRPGSCRARAGRPRRASARHALGDLGPDARRPAPRRRGAGAVIGAPQCRKWRSPVSTMAMPCSSAAATISASSHRAAGLDDGGHAGRGEHVEPVAEGEEGVAGRGRRPGPGPRPCATAISAASTRVCWPAPMPDGLAVGGDARWRWTRSGRTPARPARGRATGRRWGPPWWRTCQSERVRGQTVGVLDEEAARRGCAARARRRRCAAAPRAAGWPCAGPPARSTASGSNDGGHDHVGLGALGDGPGHRRRCTARRGRRRRRRPRRVALEGAPVGVGEVGGDAPRRTGWRA